MRKVLLTVSALLVSINVMASSQTLSSVMINGVKTHANSNPIANAFPLVYGGKDISRSVVATADESLWVGQASLIG